jgi:hypothetical protein
MTTILAKLKLAGFAAGLVLFAASAVDAQSCSMDATIKPADIYIRGASGSNPEINPGKTYDVSVRVTNSGTCTWTSTGKIILVAKIVRGPSGSKLQRDELTPDIPPMKGKVEPGKPYVFYYKIEAPYYLGAYKLEWIMTTSGKEFGSEAQKDIRVVPPK